MKIEIYRERKLEVREIDKTKEAVIKINDSLQH